MTTFGEVKSLPPLVTIQPFSPESIGAQLNANGFSLGSFASTSFPSANRAIYLPFSIAVPTVVVKLFCLNGGVTSNNMDMGIYDWTGTKLVSIGSTAQSGASAVQEFNITDTLLGPGRFFLAVCCVSGSASLQRIAGTSTEQMAAWGMYNQSSAFPLPATATFAKPASNYIPAIGLTTRTVI